MTPPETAPQHATRKWSYTAPGLARLLLPLVIVAMLAGSTVFAQHLGDFVVRSLVLQQADLCSPVPKAPEFTAARDGDTLFLPYGDITACTVLNREANLFGSVDLNALLLLTTSHGLVLLDVGYRHTYDGQPMEVEAREVPAGRAGGLIPADQEQRLQAAIQARGGPRPDVWVIEHG
jgi:hypothetical protein